MITVEELRQLVLKELDEIGFTWEEGRLVTKNDSKLFRRTLHAPARQATLEKSANWIKFAWNKHGSCFANGKDVNPEAIDPVLIEVTNQEQRELFRLARYTWSLPYTKGFGRRLQFLIMDRQNNKLIGILGLQSPPLSFPARDRLFNYPVGRKTELINQTMDIYTLGAVPPYARLLGAKLVALAATSNKVRDTYRRKYQGRRTQMEQRTLPAHLVALTTTSAYGKSSIYNRLRYHDLIEIRSLGYTEGYGAFHLDRLYPLFREFLEAHDVSTRGGFGSGPRIKWQTMVRALDFIGFDSELLRHGIQREVFLFPLIRNLTAYLEGVEKEPQYYDVTFSELSNHWRQRWLLPRAKRVDSWHAWDKESLRNIL